MLNYKLKNYKESELNPAKDPHTVEDWVKTEPKKKIKKPKRFWEDTEMDVKLSLISEEELNEIAEDYITALDEMGLGGGAGVGLSLPGGYINGAPNPKDVAKTKKKHAIDAAKYFMDGFSVEVILTFLYSFIQINAVTKNSKNTCQ